MLYHKKTESQDFYLHSTPVVWSKGDNVGKLSVQLSFLADIIAVCLKTASKEITGGGFYMPKQRNLYNLTRPSATRKTRITSVSVPVL